MNDVEVLLSYRHREAIETLAESKRMLEARQKADYRELVEVSTDEATQAVALAEEFLAAIRELLNPVENPD